MYVNNCQNPSGIITRVCLVHFCWMFCTIGYWFPFLLAENSIHICLLTTPAAAQNHEMKIILSLVQYNRCDICSLLTVSLSVFKFVCMLTWTQIATLASCAYNEKSSVFIYPNIQHSCKWKVNEEDVNTANKCL